MKNNKLILVLLVNIFFLDIQLRVRKFKSVINSYCKKYSNVDTKFYDDLTEDQLIKLKEDIYNFFIAIQYASELYPFNAKCLHRTLITYKFLKKTYKMPVKFMVGVKKFPFDSHAWLKWNEEYGEGNILDLEEDTNKYEVIIDSSKYESR
ncbi:MAG: lasso peptide biosynthesis B2 protein [Clostridium butyricum]|nr:lasso peptide biosynthesis B2 protein [Clostridium butyricum]MDU5821797.1 lasso peptide biosynthesis B2 protein [Clostridium butyricum]